MLHFVLWKWNQTGFRSRYTSHHVNVMSRMIARNCPDPHRVICVTDDPVGIVPAVKTYPLWNDHSGLVNASGAHLPSCYRRLKLFDPETQAALEIEKGHRAMSIDLDTVILDDMGPLIRRPHPFVGWYVPGARHDRVFNGSMWMFTAGEFDWMWKGFHPERSPKAAIAAGFFGSDQGYISHQLAHVKDLGHWTESCGVLSYGRDVRARRALPRHARVVFFHGKIKPWDTRAKMESRWIDQYWRL